MSDNLSESVSVSMPLVLNWVGKDKNKRGHSADMW